jgi:hypothetical protein
MWITKTSSSPSVIARSTSFIGTVNVFMECRFAGFPDVDAHVTISGSGVPQE